MYQVNSMGFNTRNENFIYTAGADGKLQFWDLKSRNKIKAFDF